jgi:hypothetical protein
MTEQAEPKHYNCPRCLCDDPQVEGIERATGACGDPECCGPAYEECYCVSCPNCHHTIFWPTHYELSDALDMWADN